MWHHRLVHCNKKAPRHLAQCGKTSIRVLSILEAVEKCTVSSISEGMRKSYTTVCRPRPRWRLEVAHVNIWGPYVMKSFKGTEYILTCDWWTLRVCGSLTFAMQH